MTAAVSQNKSTMPSVTKNKRFAQQERSTTKLARAGQPKQNTIAAVPVPAMDATSD